MKLVKTPFFWTEEGDKFYYEGKYKEAIHFYDQAIKLDPKYINAWNNKGFSLHNLGKYRAAIQCYDEAIKIDSKYSNAWLNKGISLCNLGKYNEALQSFDEAILADATNSSAWNRKGFVLDIIGKYDEALQCFDEAKKVDSHDKIDWNNKGFVLNNLGKYSEAIQCYDEAIKLDSEYKEAWINKAITLKNLGKYSAALQCFEEVIRLDCNDKSDWNNRGIAFYNMRKYTEAIQCYDEAIKLDPKFASAWRHKGTSLLKLGNFDEALGHLNKSIKLHHKYKEALCEIGKLHKKKKDFENALKFFDKALKIDPNYKDAKQNKERILRISDISPQEYFEKTLEELKNNRIKQIDFSDFDFEDNECKKLGLELKINYSLEELNLEDNKIGNEGIRYLNESLKVNNSLQVLNLAFNLFDDLTILKEIESKLEANKKSSKIENSIVDWNQIILKKKELKILILNNCNLKEIPIEINELEELINLDLQNNLLTQIPNVSKLTKLVALNLSRNKITLKLNEENIYNELSNLVTLNLPSSIKYFLIEENEGISKETKDLLYSSLFQIVLNKIELENEVESSTEFFFWLCFKNKTEIPIEKLIEKVKNLKTFNILDLNSKGLCIIPNESNLYKLQSLCTQLLLMDNQFNEFPESIFSLTKLNTLNLEDTNISFIPQTISQLTNLKEIYLGDNEFKGDIGTSLKCLSKIKSIECIKLDRNLISNISINSYNFSNLSTFSISDNKLTSFEGIFEWKTLQILNLSGNNIEIIPKEIKNLKALKKLYLNKNKIKSIPKEIRELKQLIEFEIKNNSIEEIPIIFGDLSNLEVVDVSNNFIKTLPGSMYFLNKLTKLNVQGNPIKDPPIHIACKLNDLKGYWQDLLIGEEKCNYLKLIILGEDHVGKTSLVRTLNTFNNSLLFTTWSVEEEFNNKSLPTDGIEISLEPILLSIDKHYSLSSNQLLLNIWDFGGREIYRSTHFYFLSPNSIYLILWNIVKKDEDLTKLIYWIQTIQSYIKDPMIILVGTYLDHIDYKSNFKQIEEQLYEKISSKTGISKKYIIGVSCKYGTNYDKLIQIIKCHAFGETEIPNKPSSLLGTLKYFSGREVDLPLFDKKNLKSMIGEIFPKTYFTLKKLIENEGTNRIKNSLAPVLEFNEFELISQKINLIGEELKRGLHFLHCLGFCLYFAKEKELNKYIILNCQWLADTLATLITTKRKYIHKGVLNHYVFKKVWREPKYPSKIHSILFELLQKFEIIIPITHDIEGDIYLGKSVVPALLSNETKPVNLTNLNWSEGTKILIQRIYEFNSFLPSQIFPQFMATIFSLFGLKDIEYWKDGILIKKEKIKFLIELEVLNKLIIISFVGKNFIPLFEEIQIRLETVLNKWENLNFEIYMTCPYCLNASNSNRNKCFKLKECVGSYSNQTKTLICNFSAKQGRKSEIKLEKLIPEINLLELKKLIKWNEIEIENNIIGKRSFTEVYKGKYEGTFVAIKKFKTENNQTINNNSNLLSSESIREFLLELGFLSIGNHNNLLQIVGIILSPPSIILPFANYGSLFNLIHQPKNEKSNLKKSIEEEIIYSFELVLRIALDIVLGLNYLHSLNPPILHSNLKSENVLIMNTDYKDASCVCKLSDFGLSQFSVGRFLINKSVAPRWCAPEVIEKKDETILSDIYSFGIILYELLTKQIPYTIEQNTEWNVSQNVEKSILEGIKPIYSKKNVENEFKTQIPKELYEIMELCWDNISKNRPNSKTIIKLFYSLLSNYWKEIQTYINLPSDLNER